MVVPSIKTEDTVDVALKLVKVAFVPHSVVPEIFVPSNVTEERLAVAFKLVTVALVDHRVVLDRVVTAILAEDIPTTDMFVGDRILLALKYRNRGLPVVIVAAE
jgi:hypothetical protein